MKMFTRIDQYQGAVPFTHWVVADRRHDVHRPPARAETAPRVPVGADLSERETQVLDNVITSENDVAPGDAVAAKELVQKLLERLKPEDRMVIQYLDLEQKTIAEISALTGWNTTLVKVRAFRARRKLQRFYRELTESERT